MLIRLQLPNEMSHNVLMNFIHVYAILYSILRVTCDCTYWGIRHTTIYLVHNVIIFNFYADAERAVCRVLVERWWIQFILSRPLYLNIIQNIKILKSSSVLKSIFNSFACWDLNKNIPFSYDLWHYGNKKIWSYLYNLTDSHLFVKKTVYFDNNIKPYGLANGPITKTRHSSS